MGKAFPHGRCVGFFRSAIGLDENGNPVLYIDGIQTDGYRKTELGILMASGESVYKHFLPGGLRKVYLDGKKAGVNAWHAEELNAIEKACEEIGIAIAIAHMNKTPCA